MTVVHIQVADWIDVGILITQVGAVLLAGLAFFAVQRQIRDAERHHREQLHGSLRPVITIEQAELVRVGNGVYVEVTIRNVGPGPALDVEITGWVRRLPQQQMPGWEARPYMDAECRAVNLDIPELRLRLGALDSGTSYTERLAAEPELRAVPPGGDFLVYFATYRDVFENKFPAKPRSEWHAGHTMFRR